MLLPLAGEPLAAAVKENFAMRTVEGA